MHYCVWTMSDPHWSETDQLRVKEMLIQRLVRDTQQPLDLVRAHTTIEPRTDTGRDGYLATFRPPNEGQIGDPEWLARLGRE